MNKGVKMNDFEKKFDDRCLKLKWHFKQMNDNDTYYYVKNLEKQVSQLVNEHNNQDFWDIFPKILSIDSKLSILEDFVKLDIEHFFEGEELIQMAEKDYRTYNKENFGYKQIPKAYTWRSCH